MYRIKPQQAGEHKGASAPAHYGVHNDNSLKPILDALLMRGDNLDEWILLQYIAWFDPKFISEELLLAVIGNDRGKLCRVIENLESLSIVKVVNKGKIKGLNLQPGIQDNIVKYATNHHKASEEFSQLLVAIPILLNKFLPEITDTPDRNWKTARAYTSTVESLFKHSVNRKMPIPKSEELALLSAKLGWVYEKIFLNAKKGLACYKSALVMRQSLYEGNHPDVASSLNNVGAAYYALGYVEKSITYLERGFVMRQALYPGHHPDTASSLNNIGVAYETLGDVRKGLDFLESALSMREALYGGSHPDVADSLNSVGSAYDSLGDAKRGLVYLERGLSMRQFLYGENHPDVALSLNTAGLAYQTLGNVKKALVYQERGLAIYQSLYEGTHPYVAWSLNNLGIVYKKLGYVKKGLAYLERGFSMRQSLYEWSHPDVVISLSNVGDVYAGMGDSGKYNLYKRQASSGRGFIRKRGFITDDIIMVKQKLQKKVLNQIQALSAAGTWSLKHVTGMYNWGVLGCIRKGYLEKQLGNLNNANNVKIALSLCFEAINLGIANSKEQNPRCAIEFTRAYPRLISEIVMEHPEYFILESIATTCLKKAEYGMVVAPEALNAEVGSGEEFKGNGRLSYTGESYYEYYNTAIDKLLKLRLEAVNPQIKRLDSWYLVGDRASVAGLAYKVSEELSNKIELVLAPVNLQGKHWLGLAFRKSGYEVEVVYMDSEQRAMAQDLKLGLEQGLSMNFYVSRFLELRLERQRYNNCGPEAIENFVYYLTGTRATQEGAVYLHSLLVENSLLDPKEYGLRLEENNKLIGFLSNAKPIEILEVPLLVDAVEGSVISIAIADGKGVGLQGIELIGGFGLSVGLFCKKLLYRNDLKVFDGMIRDYGIELPSGLTAIDVLLDNSRFNKLIMNRIHPDKNLFGARVAHDDTLFIKKLRDKFVDNLNVKLLLNDMINKINYVLYRTSIWFKILDTGTDLARLVREPTSVQFENVVSDVVCLYGMYFGANVYTMMIGGIETAYQIQIGEYKKAFEVTVGLANAMAFPYILLRANRPYVGFAYGALVALSTIYEAIGNAYSFALEIVSNDETLRSKTAYKHLAENLASSPFQVLYDFNIDVKEYDLQINAILFEKEKLAIKTHLQEQGEFGQKLFDYIYLPALTERYSLLNDAAIGTLTEEKKAEALEFKPLTITYGSQSYYNCIETKVLLPSDEYAEHYYCYNVERQVIEHIAIAGWNNLEVLERL